MIKRILIALDLDSDTVIATRYAKRLASQHDASITALAVVDMGGIEMESRGGGIGSMYYAEQLRESLTEEAREKAQQLLTEFKQEVEGSDIRWSVQVEEGVPYKQILEDVKYHDLFVVGHDPHFFYSRPEKRTDTLANVVKDAVAPAFIVHDTFDVVERVLIAYDGSSAATRTMQSFAQLQPFGTDLEVELLSIHEGHREEAELRLRLATEYLEAHGFSPSHSVIEHSHPDEAIVDHADSTGAQLVVAGAHSVSKIKEFAFGSTTASLLEDSPLPLFVHH